MGAAFALLEGCLEVQMKPYNIRRVPWTCQWARFGLAVEDLGPAGSRVDDVFWACHNPRACTLRLITRDECERCPFWEKAARLHQVGN